VATENDISGFINLFRGLAVVFLLTGLSLMLYAGYELLQAHYIVNNEKDIRVEGEFVDYEAETSTITRAGGHRETRVWFSRPVFKFQNKAGEWVTVKDTNFHFWSKYKEGDRVPVIVNADDYAKAGYKYSYAHLTDAHTRYFYYSAIVLLGLIFFVMSIAGWCILRTPAPS
jgi:hypothetical protein